MKIYAFDTCFHNELGNYPLPLRCEIARDLTLDGIGLTLWTEQAWAELAELGELCARHGLEASTIYLKLDLDDFASRDRLLAARSQIPAGCVIEVAITSSHFAPSSPEGDGAALEALGPLLDQIDGQRNSVSLYAHQGAWLERHADALRLLGQTGHPALGWTFSTYHWYATQEGNLRALLKEGAPRLRRVNFAGSRRLSETEFSIEPLDLGRLDLPAILGLIRAQGYAGPFGIQGFRVGGDVYGNLRRSLEALREWNQRWEKNPHWSQLVWRDVLA